MAKSRPQKTLADYVAIAISPVLIMLLVGSLVFFLLEVTYSGQFEGRLCWILFWFVFASVLISRIAIEQGAEHAAMYGLALAVATALVIFRFVDFVLGALCLLAVVWWCVNKLTWDCTLIDDNEDASGEGLLQVAGIDENGASNEGDSPPLNSSTHQDPAESEHSHEAAAGPWWHWFLGNDAKRTSRPHAPGLWVVYFSLAALPLFGVGQLLVPASDGDSRMYGFQLLWIYVAAGMGLLLTTSFLGLRRYLRQRKLKMPAAMAGTWMAMGAVLIGAILLLCVLLPRPHAAYSMTALLNKIESKARQASRIAFLRNDAGEGDGHRVGKGDNDDEQPLQADGQPAPDGKGAVEGKNEGEETEDAGGQQGEGKDNGEGKGKGKGEGKHEGQEQGKGEDQDKSQDQGNDEQEDGGKEDGGKGDDNKQPGGEGEAEQRDRQQEVARQQQAPKEQDHQEGRQTESNANKNQTGLSNVGEWLAKLAKWIVYALIAGGVLFLVVRNWSRLVNAFARLLQDLKNLWNRLFGSGKVVSALQSDRNEERQAVPPRPFAAFDNPFVTGAAHRKRPEEVVLYTFNALEAWAYERGRQRRPEQTPLEFARLLEQKVPRLSNDVRQVAQLYARIAYAGRAPSTECLDVLERLWQRMTDSENSSIAMASAVPTDSENAKNQKQS
jgi:hypothetical protein